MPQSYESGETDRFKTKEPLQLQRFFKEVGLRDILML